MSQNNGNAGKGYGNFLRVYFMRGLFFVIPIAVTIWFVRFAVDLADGWLGSAIRALARLFVPPSVLTAAPLWLDALYGLTSFIVLCAMLMAFGLVASFRIGKQGLRLVDHIFIHIPGVNSVYRSVSKMVEAFGDGNASSFQRCVFIKFPYNWTLGFVTKETVETGTGRKILAVFVPTGPNPTGGFIQFVYDEETRDAPFSTEEGLKLVVSMGVLAPTEFPQLGNR
ncbi:MAG: DUF502 domain-containing protein [Candidatus Obscuribacter sp.]|jgi:uncharacterized membrane protein|nr:DUF502 domain-containing protein [Candidatus Obscuribacter sp.]MBK7840165.1 DUF502 domain-containing protein [Candidatus Obscuribacter sp.]MBK9204300.1 DUF502 domain-containing protein [Candidatus Obscuribacter sp.]MBK9770929.1 DUF502 domain-containing protein [Candidatus Obscuribacter sp.]MBL0186467.1 DUF502 domain-containing protein [Candidatus Obscuribacter sp.]